MVLPSRLSAFGRRLGLLALVAGGASAAHGAAPDLTPFIGTWTFQALSEIDLVCNGQTLPSLIGGKRVSLSPGTTSDLILELGCNCRLDLNIEGSIATLAGTQPQSCRLVPNETLISAEVAAVAFDPRGGTMTLAGTTVELAFGTIACAAAPITGMATVVRTSTDVVTCGPPETAVGVIPYEPGGGAACSFGAGIEGLMIKMVDEQNPSCSDRAGSAGEGVWLLPDYMGKRHKPDGCSEKVTRLDFCRVDGRRLKPLTTDPSRSDQFYAVLKLGPAASACPDGSIEMSKLIDNGNASFSNYVPVIGDPGPNAVINAGPGTTTLLHFCYFRAASPGQPVMDGFPDLGFPYAVYHRFTGPQPPWVVSKSWIYSNDADLGNANAYQPTNPSDFTDVIEDVEKNTYFDLARVR
jgi:hypothetical protein